MRRLGLVVFAVSALAGCEFDRSKGHAVYCAEGGLWGCGHGTAMLTRSLANGSGAAAMGQFNRTVYPQPAQSNVSMNCTTTTMGQFINTRCD